MEKITLAKRNELLRAKAIEEFGNAQKINKMGSQLGVNVELDGEVYFVRFDVVVPKEQDLLLEDYLELLQEKIEEDNLKAIEKQKAKELKIAKDKERRLAKVKKEEN